MTFHEFRHLFWLGLTARNLCAIAALGGFVATLNTLAPAIASLLTGG